MAEIIINTIMGWLGAAAEVETTIVHTAGNWFGPWGAAAALLLICIAGKRATRP